MMGCHNGDQLNICKMRHLFVKEIVFFSMYISSLWSQGMMSISICFEYIHLYIFLNIYIFDD